MNYARDKEDAEKVAAAIEKAGGKAITVQQTYRSRRMLIASLKKTFDTVDVLDNHAGVDEFGR